MGSSRSPRSRCKQQPDRVNFRRPISRTPTGSAIREQTLTVRRPWRSLCGCAELGRHHLGKGRTCRSGIGLRPCCSGRSCCWGPGARRPRRGKGGTWHRSGRHGDAADGQRPAHRVVRRHRIVGSRRHHRELRMGVRQLDERHGRHLIGDLHRRWFLHRHATVTDNGGKTATLSVTITVNGDGDGDGFFAPPTATTATPRCSPVRPTLWATTSTRTATASTAWRTPRSS